jgi:hypothetical protein
MDVCRHHIVYQSLAVKVIAVASINEDVKDWAAYIDATPGENHAEEWQAVLDHGVKLPRSVAEALWPSIAASYKWRE